ncbi:uncharacterized protein A4U43_C03F18940 [Asparagus officinalis]|uniref:Uncharacterized protein n=1 Tax=Asparagus officinalis TaxID=4686 RepID=A0A5P1FC73_ASPOF|nr:uncharacterized protein A4U43_C03F18940 [Asparagus officinalis]
MEDQVQLQRKTIRLVLEQCQKTLELLKSADEIEDQSTGGNAGDGFESPPPEDPEADELHELLKSKVQSKDFLEKLGSIHMSASQNISLEDRASWDIVSSQDLWEDNNMDGDPDGYVHVSKEDIVEAIACFMAAYLSSLKETKQYLRQPLGPFGHLAVSYQSYFETMLLFADAIPESCNVEVEGLMLKTVMSSDATKYCKSSYVQKLPLSSR